jgi:hypothetical protein
MLAEAVQYYQVAWWFIGFPGIALLATTLAFNLLGDSLRDALDPRGERLMAALRRREGKRRGSLGPSGGSLSPSAAAAVQEIEGGPR